MRVSGGVVRSAAARRLTEVVGVGGELGGDSVDLLDEGHDVVLLAHAAHRQLGAAEELGHLPVAEAELLGLREERDGQRAGRVGAEHVGGVREALELREEPAVNRRGLVDLVDGVALGEGIGDGEHALVRRVHQLLIDLGRVGVVVLRDV